MSSQLDPTLDAWCFQGREGAKIAKNCTTMNNKMFYLKLGLVLFTVAMIIGLAYNYVGEQLPAITEFPKTTCVYRMMEYQYGLLGEDPAYEDVIHGSFYLVENDDNITIYDAFDDDDDWGYVLRFWKSSHCWGKEEESGKAYEMYQDGYEMWLSPVDANGVQFHLSRRDCGFPTANLKS